MFHPLRVRIEVQILIHPFLLKMFHGQIEAGGTGSRFRESSKARSASSRDPR